MVIATGLAYSCAPKVTKTKTPEEFSEDLTQVREDFTDMEAATTEDQVVVEKGPYVKPTHDITAQMDYMLDTLTVLNVDKPMTYYSIQVYVGNSRDEANNVREKVYRLLPDAKPRLKYQSPNYRVKVGWYINRVDANEDFQKLKKTFPGALLVSEKSYPKK